MFILDQLRETNPRLRALAWAVFSGLCLLLVGLWYVQVVSSPRYVASQRHQSLRTVRLPAIRGKILDRNLLPLVDNEPSYTIHVYLEELRDRFLFEYTNSVKPAFFQRHPGRRRLSAAEYDHLQQLARVRAASNLVQEISAVLQTPIPFDEAGFRRHYQTQRVLPWVVLDELTPVQVARFAERATALPGVELAVRARRTYPRGTTAAHVIGHLQSADPSAGEWDIAYNYRLPDFQGQLGLEALFDTELRGSAGLKTMLVNNQSYRESERVTLPPVPGRNLVLTLDLPLQMATEHALGWFGRDTRGAAVVMDARNGDLLALASSPTFDPNKFLPKLTREEWERLNDPLLRPMVNRATYGAYPPGSIFKIIVGLACLENGLNPEDTLAVEPNPHQPGRGVYYLGRRAIRDTAPPGDYNFRRAFIKSSNSYFIHYGLQAGLDRILALAQQFHLGERVEVLPQQEVSGYVPQPGLRVKRDGSRWFDGDTANVCIGQGEISVTPLQMAVMTAAVANGGKVLWPRLVARIEPDPSLGPGEVTHFLAGRVRDELKVNPRHLQLLREAMLADVEDPEGTGLAARVEGLRIAGKTGTAQVTRGRTVIDHVTWFVSFAPYDSPRYVVVVMVESGASGGTTCAPIVRLIYQAIQRRERPPPSDSQAAVAHGQALAHGRGTDGVAGGMFDTPDAAGAIGFGGRTRE
jgi:penicillin-binding protein 2